MGNLEVYFLEYRGSRFKYETKTEYGEVQV